MRRQHIVTVEGREMDDISEDETAAAEKKKLRHVEMCTRFPIDQIRERRKKRQKPLPEMVLNPLKESSGSETSSKLMKCDKRKGVD